LEFYSRRELAGMIPWYFNLPANTATYNAAWKHVLDSNELLGKYGLRTNEPSYEYYFKQFVFFPGPARQPVERAKLALSNEPGDNRHGQPVK
jgi:hypothetical protein